MANNARKQDPPGGAAIIDRRRFLKQTALATAVVSVPYLAGKKTVAFGKEAGKSLTLRSISRSRHLSPCAAGLPGVIAVIQRGQHREVHTFGVAEPEEQQTHEGR